MFRMVRLLSKSIREYKKVSLLTPLFVALEVLVEVLIPYLMAELIDKGIYGESLSMAFKFGIILFVAAIISLIFGVIANVLAARASCGVAKNLRKDLYYKVQDFSFANIDKFSTSSIVTRLTTDVVNVQDAYQMIIKVAVRTPLMLLFSLIMAFRINAKISFIFLVLIPIIGGLLILISKTAHPIFQKVSGKYDDLNNIVEENVSGIRVVKSFVLEEEERKKFNKKSSEIYNLFLKAERLLALNAPIMQTAIYLSMLLISWFGARIIITSHMTALTTGELTSLITYSIQILSSLMMLTMVLGMCTRAVASFERIAEILIEEPTLKNPEEPIFEIEDGSIEFENVSFSYVSDKKKMALKNINLSIQSGEMVGIIGSTGDGKSTLVNLIPRLYDVTEGCLKVGGKDVREYDIKTLRNEVACVLQKNVLFSGTIKENLKWGKEKATDWEIKNACRLACADEFIERFPQKYDTYIEEGGTNVSGGQKQRLAIARALLKKPKILILDDSMSAVDTKTERKIREAFYKEIPNTTKIIIAQRVSAVETANKIIVIENGRINGIGTHEELLKTNKIYQEVYESQMKGEKSQ